MESTTSPSSSDDPYLAYEGSSGSAPVSTSIAAVAALDMNGITAKAQRLALILTAQSGTRGVTIADLREKHGSLHHGRMSSALTNLHIAARIVALKEKRDHCGVYVLPEFVGDREVRPYKRQGKGIDPELIVGVLLDHRLDGWESLCVSEGCEWRPGRGVTFIEHQAEKIAEALNS